MKLKWVTFYVRNMEESIKFYKEILEFRIVKEINLEDKIIIFLENNCEVYLELIEKKNSVYQISTNNNFSIGIEIDKLNLKIQELKDNGYHTKGPINPTPNEEFYFVNDPNGFVIQLL